MASKVDPDIYAHIEWLGFVRPTGLVVSAPAMVRAGAILDRGDAEGQRLLRACTEERVFDPAQGPVPFLPDFRAFATSVLGWNFSPQAYLTVDDGSITPDLEVRLPDYDETLRPDIAIRDLDPKDGAAPWQLLVRILDPDQQGFDHVVREGGRFEASAHSRMERLLRQTGVPAGLLFDGRALRLISAPRGESSGWLDFQVGDMVQTAGRPISTAMRLLLGQARLLTLPRTQRLPALLEESRRYQSEVSERLSEQVLHALYELLRGFQAAHDASKGQLLRQPLADDPDEVYRALLTALLRVVFLLYAEERDVLPEGEAFLRHYSLGGLYERLREDAALYPDTMDQRYGAWAQLLVMFRLIHDGADLGGMHLPQRHGALFDPDRYPFLEGRGPGSVRDPIARIDPPLVPDGTIYRALEKLLVLEGERISYRALDVEEIGSVYQTMMGFRLETASGRSVAIKPQKRWGAPTAVDVDMLLDVPPAKREKWIQDRTDRQLTDKVRGPLQEAETFEALHAALLPVIDVAATPDPVPKGSMVLQPSEERRRSGSHYTPRVLTEPIVRTTLGPILGRLRGNGHAPLPAALLSLKICDPAMGSGAFLVETCRQLADSLVESWGTHGEIPTIPPDEDEVILARRLIAQRCLYGVDSNPVAVDLAKLSLWLVTLAKDHPFTFVDHALRHGDSLVGLTREQIEAFHWDPDGSTPQVGLESLRVQQHLLEAGDSRRRIREAGDGIPNWELRALLDSADRAVEMVRAAGDLVLAAFFKEEGTKDRERRRAEYALAYLNGDADRCQSWLSDWRDSEPTVTPFHWQIEFPEVFEQDPSGFDAFVGNPPFLGGSRLTEFIGGPRYQQWLKSAFPGALGQVDLCAYFFRRAFSLLRTHGVLGFLATNTISQGDTRVGGLQAILQSGGTIYAARTDFAWPGDATVSVALAHIAKGPVPAGLSPTLDGLPALAINSRLRPKPERDAPRVLASNSLVGHYGTAMGGSGFAINREEYDELVRDPRNLVRLDPLLGGEDVNTSPSQSHERYVVNFGTLSYEEAQGWPELLQLVRERVKPGRDRGKDHGPGNHGKKFWWQYTLRGDPLYAAVANLSRCLVTARVTTHLAFAMVSTNHVFNEQLSVFALDSYCAFAVLQSRVHEVWARMHSSHLGRALRYSVTYCFDTFPFPEANPRTAIHDLEVAGEELYSARAAYMIATGRGLTQLYNLLLDSRIKDPGILELRRLHEVADAAVLAAYGWHDVDVPPYSPGGTSSLAAFEDEVLDRLYLLNAARAQAEHVAGLAVKKKRGSTKSRASSGRSVDEPG